MLHYKSYTFDSEVSVFFSLCSMDAGRFDDSVIEERRQCSEDLLQFSANIPVLYSSQHIQDFFKVPKQYTHTHREKQHSARETTDLCNYPQREARSTTARSSSAQLNPSLTSWLTVCQTAALTVASHTHLLFGCDDWESTPAHRGVCVCFSSERHQRG